MSQADNSVKDWRHLLISNPKPDLLNINAFTKFDCNPLIVTRYRPETKLWAWLGQITPSKFDENCPLAISKQIFTIRAMHIQSLVKILWCLLKLSSRNGYENMDVSRADNSVKIWRNLPSSNPKPDLYNINAHTKFDKIPLMFIQVIIRKRNVDRRTYDWRTDGQTHGCPTWNHNTSPLWWQAELATLSQKGVTQT